MKKLTTTVKDFISLLWQDGINFLHVFDPHSQDKDVRPYSKELRRDGIIEIKDFLSPEACDDYKQQIEAFIAEHPNTETLENGTFLHYRGKDDPDNPDFGMIDVAHIDRSLPSINSINDRLLVKILESATNQEIIPVKVNTYINDSITGTRGYHIDNTQPVIYKAFVYLADVPDLSYGPYSFVKGSHRFSLYTYLNLFLNIFNRNRVNTDMPLFNKRRVKHCTGKKGTLIMSHQNAIHRGMPQEVGKKRMALVFSYFVRSKLSYIHSSSKQVLAERRAFA